MTKILLPALPVRHPDEFAMLSADDLRARDLEVARVVMEAAAQAADRVAAQYVGESGGHSAERAGCAIRNLEFGHE